LTATSWLRPLLGGALLAELALAGVVDVEPKQGWFHRPEVLARQTRVPDPPDTLMSQAWQRVAERPRTPVDLVERLGAGTRDAVEDRLAERGVLAVRVGKGRGLLTRPCAVLDEGPGREVRTRLQQCLVSGQAP